MIILTNYVIFYNCSVWEVDIITKQHIIASFFSDKICVDSSVLRCRNSKYIEISISIHYRICHGNILYREIRYLIDIEFRHIAIFYMMNLLLHRCRFFQECLYRMLVNKVRYSILKKFYFCGLLASKFPFMEVLLNCWKQTCGNNFRVKMKNWSVTYYSFFFFIKNIAITDN